MDTTRSLMLAIATFATPALGQGLTVVNEPWPGEASHSQMLSSVFGGTFSSMGQVSGFDNQTGGSGTVDIGFSNGSVSAIRVGDASGSSTPNLASLLGSLSDETYGAGSYGAQIIGHNSSLAHEFGTMTDGTFTSLLSSGSDDTVMIHPGDEFNWAIRTASGRTFSSESEFNGGVDHMVTYALLDDDQDVIGAVLFFEDWFGSNSDYDYNDLGILLTLAPTPHAAMLGVAGLGGLGLMTGRRRR